MGIIVPVTFLSNQISSGYYGAQEDTLVDLAELTAQLVSHNAVAGLYGVTSIDTSVINNAFIRLNNRKFSVDIYSLQKNEVAIRIYITNKRSRVVFDSDNGRDVGEDYSIWRDVYLASIGEYGARATLGDPLYPDGHTMYVAAPIIINGEIVGTLSVGKSTKNAEQFVTKQLDKVLIAGLIIFIMLAIFGFGLHTKFTKPLEVIQNYALKTSAGKKSKVPAFSKDEIGDVGRALEKMKNKLDGKAYISNYVQNLTHEIKAPIAGIKGSAELLKDPVSVEDRQRFLTNITTQTTRIQDLVERMLELASLEYQSSLTSLEEMYLPQIIADVVKDKLDYAESKSVSFDVKSDPNLTLIADKFLVKQALSNILKNAIEYSFEDGVIQIRAQAEKEIVLISISDQGTGIPDYAQDKVLDRFYSTPKPNGENGSGLGLCFVKEIMELHEGEIKIEANQPSGTKVSLLFNRQNR
jgi:two-component system sensor histidine kinase CreC